MPRLELALPQDRFQPHPGYREVSRSPANVVDRTSYVLRMYFAEGLADTRQAREYLASDTIDFIYSARKSFLTDARTILRARKLTREDEERLFALAKPHFSDSDIEEREAFGYSIVVFSALPYYADHSLLPDGFSKRGEGVLAPPKTTMGFYNRLVELSYEIQKIISGETLPEHHIEGRNSLWRTYEFFKVGGEIPLHLETSKKEIEQRARETVENLLGDIKIDL